MAFKKYTQCFTFGPLGSAADPPFQKKELADIPIEYGGIVFSFTLSGLILGLPFTPVGAAIGALIGAISGIVSAVSLAISNVADKWLNHRLVCLSGTQCAVGTVAEGPKYGDLGDFDNDHFFDVRLMPHRPEDNYVTLFDPTKPKTEAPLFGTVVSAAEIVMYPKNEIYVDGLQGETLLRPDARFLPPKSDLGYNNENKESEEMHTASMLHCEAEGDFWVRMKSLSLAIGLLVAVGVGVAAAGAAAGSYAGSAAGCALGAWFFGPIGCTIGAIIGGILGGAVGTAVAGGSAAIGLRALLQALFDADPGDVEDANVGDTALGPIKTGSRVAVLGEHVYDGFHSGWHEFHPLMAVMKIEPDDLAPGQETKMLQWDPYFPDGRATPRKLPEIGGPDLTPDDMRRGMSSDNFAKRAEAHKTAWCKALQDAFDATTRTTQQRLEHRWTIHPAVDGCVAKD